MTTVYYLQGENHFHNKRLLEELLKRLDHPDFDVKERVFLALFSLVRWPHIRSALWDAGALELLSHTRDRCKDLLENAADEDKDSLRNFLVLGSDLEDQLRQDYFNRSEL